MCVGRKKIGFITTTDSQPNRFRRLKVGQTGWSSMTNRLKFGFWYHQREHEELKTIILTCPEDDDPGAVGPVPLGPEPRGPIWILRVLGKWQGR